MFLPERLDFDIDPRRQVELRQGFHGRSRGLQNIDQALVRPDFKLFARLLIRMGRPQHAVLVLDGRQRNRTRNLRARPFGCRDNFRRRMIQYPVVVTLQSDSNFLM